MKPIIQFLAICIIITMSQKLNSQQYLFEGFGAVTSSISIDQHFLNGNFENKNLSFEGNALIEQVAPLSNNGGAYLLLNGIGDEIIIGNIDSDNTTTELIIDILVKKNHINVDNSSLQMALSFDGITFDQSINVVLPEGINWQSINYFLTPDFNGIKKIKFINTSSNVIQLDGIKIDNTTGLFGCAIMIDFIGDDQATGSQRYGSLRGACNCIPTNSTIAFHSSITNIIMINPLTIEKNISLTNIATNPINLNFNSQSANVVVSNNASLTLQKIIIKENASNNISPIILIDGVLILSTSGIKSVGTFFPNVRNNNLLEVALNSGTSFIGKE